ncbi:MAG TPA: nucleotidyl transferase AbiEii/AbiGii toxin family protein [Methylocella sp.]|nr:nucleotidyl transferase AbiEii/AbiGii toxin family protein [Methylocella sp.]
MIPAMNIIAWSAKAPWADMRQVEQDLIISRALVELFADPMLSREVRFRGGTALHKLHLPKPLRYSEDIDLVRTAAGPIGPLLDRIRERLEPWLGRAAFEQSETAPKLRFRTEAEDGSGVIRLKVEINTREIRAFDPPQTIRYEVENPWYTGGADIATFSCEELLATKLRALLQRDKGRDLLDLFHALETFQDLNTARLVECFGLYLDGGGTPISRAQAEQRMFAKLAAPRFMTDIRPLLAPEEAAKLTDTATRHAFVTVFDKLITAMSGEPWAKTPKMKEKFGMD